jgi:hypothetical protein
VVAAVVVVFAVVVGASAAGHDRTGDRATQMDRLELGCSQWTDAYEGADGPAPTWCGAMAGWMGSHMGPSSASWRSPGAMQRACVRWAATSPPTSDPGTDATGWCRQMVTWMNHHMGDWDDWMGGPMMGGR